MVSTAVVKLADVQPIVVLHPVPFKAIVHDGVLVKLADGGDAALIVKVSLSVLLTVPVPLVPDQQRVWNWYVPTAT